MFSKDFRTVVAFTLVYGFLAAGVLLVETALQSRGTDSTQIASAQEQGSGFAGMVSLAAYDLASAN